MEKAYFIGYMVHRLISAALGRSSEDDRDHYGKKRVDLAGVLLSGLFRQLFRKFTKDAQMVLKRQLDEGKGAINLTKALKPQTITRGLRYGLATGNWGTNKMGQVSKTGVSQSLNRLTYSASLSHLRRLNTPLQKTGKLAKPRQLHNTHWGMICPAETPEGQSCGLVKNLALMAVVSVGSNIKELEKRLQGLALESLFEINAEHLTSPKSTKVFLNGNWIGVHENASTLLRQLKLMRKENFIDH